MINSFKSTLLGESYTVKHHESGLDIYVFPKKMTTSYALFATNFGAVDHALDEEGLQRAYDAVRSGKYRSERDMMADPEFVKRAAADEGIKKRVIEEYLQSVARNGDAAPQGITEGGSVPLTGKKTGAHSMAQAKQKLESMLGVKR